MFSQAYVCSEGGRVGRVSLVPGPFLVTGPMSFLVVVVGGGGWVHPTLWSGGH